MIKLTKFALMFCTAAIAGGCASTSSQNDTPQYPVLKVLSDKPYVWDDSISEALNVAKMAKPSGVGIGLMDYPDGAMATTGRVGEGAQLFDSALGIVDSGLFGLFQMGALNNGVNKPLEWKPSIVQIIKSPQGNPPTFLELRDSISQNIWQALVKAGVNVDLIAVGTMKAAHKETDNKYTSNITLLFKGGDCEKARINDGAKGVNMVDAGKHYYDVPLGTTGTCSFSVRTTIAGKTQSGDAIVISEIRAGYTFIEHLQYLKDAYVLVPDYFKGVGPTAVFKGPYAFVMKGSEKLLFQKP